MKMKKFLKNLIGLLLLLYGIYWLGYVVSTFIISIVFFAISYVSDFLFGWNFNRLAIDWLSDRFLANWYSHNQLNNAIAIVDYVVGVICTMCGYFFKNSVPKLDDRREEPFLFEWILLIAFVLLTYYYSTWFIVGVCALAIWKLNRWYTWSSRPWRKVHFPMMRAYATASGLEAGHAEKEGRDFDIEAALRNLLVVANPKISLSHDDLIKQVFDRCRTFYDRPLIEAHYIQRGFLDRGLDKDQVIDEDEVERSSKLLMLAEAVNVQTLDVVEKSVKPKIVRMYHWDTALNEIEQSLKSPSNSVLIRMVIAEVVEEQFSSQDRGEYMFEVFCGKKAF